MDLIELQQTLRRFAVDRNWQEFHTPKNLSMALVVEAVELMELFQWKTPQESVAVRLNPHLQVHVGEELADVLLYLLQLADHTGVDLNLAVVDRLSKNAKKYPLPGVQAAPVSDVQKSAQTHVLVDWENVQPKDVDILDLVPDVTNVWIFHGPNQKRVDVNQKSFGNALTLVPISRAGKNSLDFHLSYYVGYISSRNPNARFVVISNDQGYAPMLEHAKVLGFAASQVGFGTVRVAAKRAASKKTPAKKASSAKKSMKQNQKSASVKPESVSGKPAAKKAPKVVMAKTATKMPTSAKSPKGTTSAKEAIASTSKPKRTTAPAATPAAVVVKRTPAVKKKAPVPDDEKAYAHVLASLRKSKNKPTRKARLYGAVKSLLGEEKASNVAVERVVKRLVAEGHLAIDGNGAVTKTP